MAMGSEDAAKDEEKEKSDKPCCSIVPLLSMNDNLVPPSNDVIRVDDKIDDVIRADDKIDDVTVFDDDDAAVILEELSLNFGVFTRAPSRGSAALLSVLNKSVSRNGSVHSPRTLLRTCLTKVLVETSLKVGKGSGQIERLLSAKRNHIHNLSNEIVVLEKKIKDLEERNRILVRITKRQESALKRYHDAETEIPHLLEAHRMEIQILQDKLRKAMDLNKKDSEKLKNADNKILKLNDEVNTFKQLSQKKNLPERQSLSNKLTTALTELNDKQNENLELNRRILILNKSFHHQITSEATKHKSTSKKLETLQAEHEKTVQKLTDCEKQLATLRLYRSNSIRNRSSSTSSSTATTATADIPGPVSSSENNITSTRKSTRKYTARRLKQSNPGKLSASSSREKKLSAPLSKKNSCSRLIDDENVLIDLDMKAIGWTSECKINTKKRRGSARLPPLASDFREEFKKISESPSPFSSDNISSPDEFISSDNPSHSNDYQTSSVAFQDSTSRKTTIMSSWSDETQAEDFSLSRSNSPPTTVQKFINFESENENSATQNENGKDTKEEDGKKALEDRKEEKDKINDNEEDKIEEGEEEIEEGEEEIEEDDEEIDEEDSFFNDSPRPTEERSFSLIENYPPKERRKLEKENDQCCNKSTTNIQEKITSQGECPSESSGSAVSSQSQFKNDSDIQSMRGKSASVVRSASIRRKSSLITADITPLIAKSSIEATKNSKEEDKPSN